MSWKVWIDTGGTFTDCIGIDVSGEIKRVKLLSNSTIRGQVVAVHDPSKLEVALRWNVSRDIFKGYTLRILGSDTATTVKSVDISHSLIYLDTPLNNIAAGATFELTAGEEVPVFGARLLTETGLSESLPKMEMRLGSTRGTNALLEYKGVPTLLVTNKGFKDVLTIGNQQRPNLFELEIIKPEPLYTEVVEVQGRLDCEGNEIKPVEDNYEIFRSFLSRGIRSVAISLIHSYRNGEQEEFYKSLATKAGFKHVSCSHQVSPHIKYLDRTTTTVVNAYLDPIITEYVNNIATAISGKILIMSSAGGLMDSGSFLPKDSLLSGPAGGVVGASQMARMSGVNQIITFDMGGTSTDVALYDSQYDYRYTSTVGPVSIQSPSLAIETIAAGGGSVCRFDGYKFTVGPESMGASPGPACYGEGGELTITDVNLLLGRLDPSTFNIPLDVEAAKRAYHSLTKGSQEILGQGEENLLAILQIANEKMADAIRAISVKKGLDPKEYQLLSFGGAGGQHACALASILNMDQLLIPYDAGLLSAKGIGMSEMEEIATRQVLLPLSSIEDLAQWMVDMESAALGKLNSDKAYVRQKLGYFRFSGQEDTIEIDLEVDDIEEEFTEKYELIYGHWIEGNTIELESLKVIAAIREKAPLVDKQPLKKYMPKPVKFQRTYTGSEWHETPVYQWEQLEPGAFISGPSILVSDNSTVFCEPGWQGMIDRNNTLVLNNRREERSAEIGTKAALLELYTNRFYAVADEMGTLLQRTAFSVNIRERLDFSCGILDESGELIVNAPHIPVHLGSLGMCVRMVREAIVMQEGDVVITNHPYYGGSHLPDISLIAPVHYQGELIGYVANRAHHAELGGKTPGSMPTDASFLDEEGIVIRPDFLIREEKPQWDKIRKLLSEGAFPSRAIEENIADLKAALASILRGREKMIRLCEKYGQSNVTMHMLEIKKYAAELLGSKLNLINLEDCAAEEFLDDGSKLAVNVSRAKSNVVFDFSGTGPQHARNLNATPSIVNSVVLYVLRLLLKKDFPLNEGLLQDIVINLPNSLLNPMFFGEREPAVVGGNTEVSQRLTDTLLKAFKLAACSQGTMNNLLFGNAKFGYYETICGGVGAGPGFHGAHAVHQHMTNTRITDVEVMELRYPVILNRFEVRKESGGRGAFIGGNGIIRELQFTEEVTFTLLGQHRVERPYGMNGGEPGKAGTQYFIDSSGPARSLKGICNGTARKGDVLIIETPGGGGYGLAKEQNSD